MIIYKNNYGSWIVAAKICSHPLSPTTYVDSGKLDDMIKKYPQAQVIR